MSPSSRRSSAPQARRKALESTLLQLARTAEQLEAAVRAFDQGFDREAFSTAWYSSAPRQRNRAMLVRSNMDDLHNLCQALIALSVRVAHDEGAIPADRKTPAADQLRALGRYPKDVAEVMREVVGLRNASQHEYWILTPEEVHAAVNRQRQYLPSFIADVGTWVEGILTETDPSS
ncbi:MAG TPA: HepT-like ribonuclease domain-containing protein [Solirubrobacteraceae bacterium]|nr:HepT-like ribonuclease domain-containing protein [Solirubrobacteraceae bacterium]